MPTNHTEKYEIDSNNRFEVTFDEETQKLKFFIWNGEDGIRFEMTEGMFAKLSFLAQCAKLKPVLENFKLAKGTIISHPVDREIPKGWREYTKIPRAIIASDSGELSVMDNRIYLEFVGEDAE